ncbi:conserved hypothetical protein, secreted [Candidatus Magnetomorum sp. HK-1]|nr:conserved hypothetical protein, secreted [Candidatus Magnetomorum sp. HK-1]
MKLWNTKLSHSVMFILAALLVAGLTGAAFGAEKNLTLESKDATGSIMSWNLDVDDDGDVRALTDGLLIVRYLFSFNYDGWIDGFVGDGAERASAVEIESYIESGLTQLDIDQDGETRALTDGILVTMYLLKFNLGRADWVHGFIGDSALRSTAAEIESYILSLIP